MPLAIPTQASRSKAPLSFSTSRITCLRWARVLGLGIFVQLALLAPAHAQDEPTSETELAALIKKAQNNPLAEAAHQRTLFAAAQGDEAAGNRWPRFDATAFVAPSPRVRCDNADCTQTSPRDVTVNIAGVYAGVRLGVTQPLYTGGKIQFGREAATAARHANQALEEEFSGRVAVLVAEAYYGYLLAQELLWMLEEGEEHIESGRKTLDQKLEEGAPEASVQDRFRIQTLQSEVRARIADAKHGKLVALESMRALIGDERATLGKTLLEPITYALPSTSPSADQDPRLRAAKHAVQAQTALENLEKRNFLPDIAIVGGANLARAQGVDDPPGAFANDPYNTSSLYVALSARWQLAPWVQAAKTRQQRAKKREAIATAEAARRQAKLDSSTSMAKAVLASDRLTALKDGERAGKAWVASVLQADAIGGASAKDLADAYLAYFSARANVLESTHKWNIAVFELRRQAGEFAPSR